MIFKAKYVKGKSRNQSYNNWLIVIGIVVASMGLLFVNEWVKEAVDIVMLLQK